MVCVPGNSQISHRHIYREPSHSANKNDIVLWRASRSEVGVARWVLSKGFCLALPRVRFGVPYSDTLSARDVSFVLVPRPTGSLTARVLANGGSALPRVSTSSLVLRQSSPETARPLSHWLVSAAPHALTGTRPFGHSPVFPHPDVKRVYLDIVNSFIARNPHNNAHTTSLVITPSCHIFSG